MQYKPTKRERYHNLLPNDTWLGPVGHAVRTGVAGKSGEEKPTVRTTRA